MADPKFEQMKQEKDQITQAYLSRGQEIARLSQEVSRLEQVVVQLQKNLEAAEAQIPQDNKGPEPPAPETETPPSA
jgi:predicted  nucleic acid-binding Zn-ribbon protein